MVQNRDIVSESIALTPYLAENALSSRSASRTRSCCTVVPRQTDRCTVVGMSTNVYSRDHNDAHSLRGLQQYDFAWLYIFIRFTLLHLY